MKLPFFATFVAIGIWLTIMRLRVKKVDKKTEDAFWERERAADAAADKPLDDLEYITVPLEKLPFGLLPDNDNIAECERILRTFTPAERTTVNLTGLSNTDLKLAYGAGNLEKLTLYDQNYTLLARTLQKWASYLIAEGLDDEAAKLLAFAISTRTDVSATYKEYARILHNRGDKETLLKVREVAQDIKTPLKDSIIRNLDEVIASL